MPGSGPPVPDLVLDAIRDGATFVIVKGEHGGLDVDGVVQRLAVSHSVSDLAGVWRLSPDGGSYITAETFAALKAWASSGSRVMPVQFDEGQLFGLGIFADSVAGVPIARVVITQPLDKLGA